MSNNKNILNGGQTNKKHIALLVIGVILLTCFVLGVTYAMYGGLPSSNTVYVESTITYTSGMNTNVCYHAITSYVGNDSRTTIVYPICQEQSTRQCVSNNTTYLTTGAECALLPASEQDFRYSIQSCPTTATIVPTDGNITTVSGNSTITITVTVHVVTSTCYVTTPSNGQFWTIVVLGVGGIVAAGLIVDTLRRHKAPHPHEV